MPGRQVQCRVFEELAGSVTNFVACDNPGNLEASSVLPCYTIQTGDEACGDFETQLAVQIHGRNSEPHRDSRLKVGCLVDE